MQQENITVTAAPYAKTPRDPSYVSAGSQDISGTALIAQVNILYIKIVDSSNKKRPLCDGGLSYDEIIVIIVIIGIADIFPFSLIAMLKKKQVKRERFAQLLRFQFYKNMKFRHDL